MSTIILFGFDAAPSIGKMSMLRKNAGNVYFVGMAARLVTSAKLIAIIDSINKRRLLPEYKTAMLVSGVKMQPCAAKITPSHRRRLCCWALHQ